MSNFLITTREEMKVRGWQELDFVLISGDAYVDHPGFAAAIIGRLLESKGYRVGIIAQPEWHDAKAFMELGRPRLASLVTAGNLDSMLNKRTAAKKIRNNDSYSPGGESGHRPDRATLVYANRMREAYKTTPVIIGGIEASLRRFAHYDYWSNQVRRSILLDSKADILIYGMGEKQIVELAAGLDKGKSIAELGHVKGTCCLTDDWADYSDGVLCPSYEDVKTSKKTFAVAFKMQYDEQDPYRGRTIVQPSGDKFLIQNPPALPLTTAEMDEVYGLPYQRVPHPMYDAVGGVPAIQEVQFSLDSHRGCFGACKFCAITSHQGRIIQHRSHESLLSEVEKIKKLPNFKGYIHDVGGPTANFRHRSCKQQETMGTCRDRNCIGSDICPNLDTSHDDYLALLRKIRHVSGIKKVFVRSGLRYDYVLADHNRKFVKELCEYHVSGQLKVAPEHCVNSVTDMMGKSNKAVFLKFREWFDQANQELGKKQFLVPYFMSSHPGCTLADAVELAEFLRDLHRQPEQVQDFIPTPGSLATAMYYTGLDPLTGEKVYVARNQNDKKMQRSLMQYGRPENYEIVHAALMKAGRRDLIGFGPNCLIRPRPDARAKEKNNFGRRPSERSGVSGKKKESRRPAKHR